jgi:hypothetical protein
MIPRNALTKIFLDQWGKSSDDINVQLFSRKWWFSSRVGKQTAYRLSDDGLDFLTNTLELKSYEIPFSDKIELSPQTIIFLERYLDCPYYLTHRSITVFAERKCVELYFFSDDIRRYGLSKAMKDRQNNL